MRAVGLALMIPIFVLAMAVMARAARNKVKIDLRDKRLGTDMQRIGTRRETDDERRPN